MGKNMSKSLTADDVKRWVAGMKDRRVEDAIVNGVRRKVCIVTQEFAKSDDCKQMLALGMMKTVPKLELQVLRDCGFKIGRYKRVFYL